MDDAFYIAAPRLSLVTIPTPALANSLCCATSDFSAPTTLHAAGLVREVTYPMDWPGDASKMFAALLVLREEGAKPGRLLGAIVDRTLGIAVGNMGTHGPPVAGRIEVGTASFAPTRAAATRPKCYGSLRVGYACNTVSRKSLRRRS